MVIRLFDGIFEYSKSKDQRLGHFPGFDFIRLVAAGIVVFSHSFLIGEGNEKAEPFRVFTGEIGGVYAVFLFLMLSGALVTESALRSPSLISYAGKRLTRILPGFLACNLILLIFLCPWFDRRGPVAFLQDPASWLETMRLFLFQISTALYRGVAFYAYETERQHWIAMTANGVTWTIRLELTCYLFVALLRMARFLDRWATFAVLILVAGLIEIASRQSLFDPLPQQLREYLGGLAFILPSFATGVLLHRIAVTGHRARGLGAIASLVLLCGAVAVTPQWLFWGTYLFPLLMLYPLLWAGQFESTRLIRLSRLGDPSYGVYLWGWPIQQCFRAAVGPVSGYALTALALPVAIVAGYLSFHLLEKPAMRFFRRRSIRRRRVGGSQELPSVPALCSASPAVLAEVRVTDPVPGRE